MVGSDVRLMDVGWDTDSETLVWLENRGGQGVLVVQSGLDAPRDLTGEDMSVRGRVGYGGGDFTIADSIVYFAGPHGRLYRLALDGGKPRPIAPGFGSAAAPQVSPDGRWVVYVHTYEDVDGLAVVDTNGTMWPRKLAYGSDFVMQPVWHPDGQYLAYIAWDHPNMPWDGTQLNLGKLAYDHDGVPYLESIETIAGDPQTAIFQPAFSPDGRYLSYISNETGWGHLYIHNLETGERIQITHGEVEHGTPAWVQGLRVYCWGSDTLYFLRNVEGFLSLHRYNFDTQKETQNFALRHYSSMGQPTLSDSGALAMIASSSTISPRVISFTAQGGVRVHRRAGTETLFPQQLSQARAIRWDDDNNHTIYGLYYPPASDRFESIGPPPLVVEIHGGPSSQTTAGYRAEVQFFTTRGYAVLCVNYRGSTGYGRDYLRQLDGQWGVADVEDAASGVAYLVAEGLADPSRVVIMGGSAGGYTVLQSLINKPGVYKAGVCRYGVTNLFTLVQETHKFEARYTDKLVGKLPETADIYRERSPIFRADQIHDPLVVFQGSDDQVVPLNQAETLVAALKGPNEYHVYQGEGHGFRKPEHVEHYYETMLRFLTQYVIYA